MVTFTLVSIKLLSNKARVKWSTSMVKVTREAGIKTKRMDVAIRLTIPQVIVFLATILMTNEMVMDVCF